MVIRAVAIALMLTLAACGETDGSEPVDDQPTDDSTSSTTTTKRATLYGALPADGESVQGELHLIAVVESDVEATAKFLIDGAPIAEIDESPYRLSMSACDLSVGNHAYIVEITDANGNRDFVEQWFTVEGCD